MVERTILLAWWVCFALALGVCAYGFWKSVVAARSVPPPVTPGATERLLGREELRRTLRDAEGRW